MRLIDADAEIAKIEQEIQKIKSRIKEWEENREDRSGCHDVDGKISQFKSNIQQAQTEIECLKRYSTAFDVGKVMERLEEYAHSRICNTHEHGCPYLTNDDVSCENCGAMGALEIVKSGGIE